MGCRIAFFVLVIFLFNIVPSFSTHTTFQFPLITDQDSESPVTDGEDVLTEIETEEGVIPNDPHGLQLALLPAFYDYRENCAPPDLSIEPILRPPLI